jgi:NAD(P)H-hydrate epimerase
VIGPGLGDAPATAEAVATFLAEYDRRVVVDADALHAVPDVDTDAEVICTPHQGELREMGGETAADPVERARLVRAFAAELGHTLLVKGRQDVIAGVPAEPGHDGSVVTRRNRTGNPGMTVGGTGDVLAGVVGALTTRTTPFVAAAAGAYVNGLAGDAAAEANGHGLVATDLIDRLPQALYDE